MCATRNPELTVLNVLFRETILLHCLIKVDKTDERCVSGHVTHAPLPSSSWVPPTSPPVLLHLLRSLNLPQGSTALQMQAVQVVWAMDRC